MNIAYSFLLTGFLQYLCIAFISYRTFSDNIGTYVIEWGNISSIQGFLGTVFFISLPWPVLASAGFAVLRLLKLQGRRTTAIFFAVAQITLILCELRAIHDVAELFYSESGATWQYWELPSSVVLSNPVDLLCFLFSVPVVTLGAWLIPPSGEPE